MSSVEEIIDDVLTVNGGLTHFGVKGMHWGVRNSVHPDIAHIPKGTRKEAKKDAEEFTRAKLFFGVGAGTRRKLIKAKVESKKAKDPLYSKAFDHYVNRTDLGKRADQARSERKRKNTKNYVKKTAKGVGHVVRGNNQYANISAIVGVGVGSAILKKHMEDNARHADQLIADILDENGSLSHHGIKGMKWGQRRAERKLARGDAKFRKNAISLKGRIEVNNASAEHFNAHIDAINNKPHYVAARDRGDFLNPKSAMSKQYNNEVSNLYMNSVRHALAAQGTNPSGTKKLELRPTGQFSYDVALVDVKHADEMYSIIFDRDENGMITGVRLNEMMQGELFIDDILEHHGVKGMKWGVRRGERTSTSGVLSELSGKPEQRRDERWRNKKIRGNTFSLTSKINRQVEKDTHKAMKPDIKALNKRPEFSTSEAKKAIKQASKTFGRSKDNPIAQKYYDEHMKIWKKHLIANADKHMMTSPSGKWETKLWVSTSMNGGAWNVGVRRVGEATHAENSDMDVVMSARPIFDDEGYIIDWELVSDDMRQSAIEDILEHHGIKGMKWGVRRKATVGAQEVIVSDKRKKLKTSGGQGHPSHSDAVTSRATGQIARKSGTKALSNAQLKAYNERLNLEQNFKRLQYEDSSPGRKFVLGALRQTGKQSSQDLGTESAKQIKRVVKIAAAAAA